MGAANTDYLAWFYTDGTQTGTSGIVNGSVTFPGGLATIGSYEARLFFGGTFTVQSTASFTVQNGGPPPTIAPGKSMYNPGAAIVANFANASGSPFDSIGLYTAGSSNNQFLQWLYVNGSQTATVGVLDGSVSFQNGLANPGNYEMRLLADNTMTVEATAAFTVENAPPTMASSPIRRWVPSASVSPRR